MFLFNFYFSELFTNGRICQHLFCADCMKGYLTSKTNDGIVLKIGCPVSQGIQIELNWIELN